MLLRAHEIWTVKLRNKIFYFWFPFSALFFHSKNISVKCFTQIAFLLLHFIEWFNFSRMDRPTSRNIVIVKKVYLHSSTRFLIDHILLLNANLIFYYFLFSSENNVDDKCTLITNLLNFPISQSVISHHEKKKIFFDNLYFG